MKYENIIGIIPARYASTRFPGKPLAKIHGVSMIERVYRQCLQAKSLQTVFVATDDERIFNHVLAFGGKAVMTSAKHPTGTDRCMEAVEILMSEHVDIHPHIVVNIQGDEPLIDPLVIDAIAQAFSFPDTQIATVAAPFANINHIENTNTVKIVTDLQQNALYFSRLPIPYFRDDKPLPDMYLKHIGMYAFRIDILKSIVQLPQSSLEKAEALEQLRWLENGFKIKVIKVRKEGFCVDVPEDISVIEDFMNKHHIL